MISFSDGISLQSFGIFSYTESSRTKPEGPKKINDGMVPTLGRIDARRMIVSEPMLYIWTALIFSFTSHWWCYVILARSRYLKLVDFTINFLCQKIVTAFS